MSGEEFVRKKNKFLFPVFRITAANPFTHLDSMLFISMSMVFSLFSFSFLKFPFSGILYLPGRLLILDGESCF